MLDDDVSNPLGTALIPRLRIRVRASFLLLNRLPDGEGLRAQVGSDTGQYIRSPMISRSRDISLRTSIRSCHISASISAITPPPSMSR